MSGSEALTLAYFVTAAVLIIFLWRLRRIPRTSLTDYMRGLRFVKGSFAGVLGPGSYQPVTRRVQIEVVDMRPVPFILESVSYRDALQSESLVSIGAELLVEDPYLAATSLRNRVNDSLPIVRDALRTVVSRSIADPSLEFRARAVREIEGAVNAELGRTGMKISNLEITELFSRSPLPQRSAKGLN